MARLPEVGGDLGNWGAILNDYLSVSHSDSGVLKTATVTTQTVQDGAITEGKLAAAVQTKLNASDVTPASTVNHGSAASTARPAISNPVVWVGSVQPANWVSGDIWIEPDEVI